jgi:TatD DNase family protein
MIETDCPYLAPHPMRGKLNHSGYLHYTAETLADVHGVSVEELAQITCDNAKIFFGI